MIPKFFSACLVCLLSLSLETTGFSAATQVPLSFKKERGQIVAAVPDGLTQLWLEGRSGGGWKPLAVQYLKATKKGPKSTPGGKSSTSKASFTVPKGYDLRDLRVMGSAAKFPAKFVTGTKSFSRNSNTPSGTTDLRLTADALAPATAATNTAVPDTSGASSVAVVESDIWKVIGNRLFFFNQYRGLQVFDVSKGDAPVRTGTLRLPASGEQFFALNADGSYLGLLGSDQSAAADSDNPYAVFVLSVTKEGSPALVTKLPVQGYVSDSRLIGTRLYVVSSNWTWTNNQWDAHTVLQGFDLSDPKQPVVLAPLNLDGYAPVLQATDQTLLVAVSDYADWYHSQIHVVGINNPQGLPVLAKTLEPKGRIDDKFKVNVSGDTVSAVSFFWDASAGNIRQTWVETFPLSGADTAALAQLHLEEADGESLHATRFDGSRLYVVTFKNVDPLFVVDLSDPSAPVIKGQVAIPGWSSYIQPFGDRLLTVGVESGKVAISLFDVADASAPALLSRVTLGDGYSWSEANYDEKAVGFFPDQGELLVPYQTWSSSGGWQSATGVLTFDRTSVTYKSSILHEFTARRAALVGSNIVSISGQELIIEGAADLSALQLLAQLSISWRVDRVIPFGGKNLIQIEDGSAGIGLYGAFLRIAYNAAKHPMLRISRTDDPDALSEEVDMGEGQIIGTAQKGNRFYVGQYVPATDGSADLVRTWVFDASAPPALPEITHVDTSVPAGSSQFDLSNAQALWPNGSTLVWHLPTQSYWGFWGGPIAYLADTTTAVASTSVVKVASSSASLIVAGGGGQTSNVAAVVFPLALGNPDAPTPLAPVAISGAAAASVGSGSSKAFAGGGFLFAAYDENVLSNVIPQTTTPVGIATVLVLPVVSVGTYATKTWLQVLDFRQSGNPVARDRTSIPGQLLAVSDIDDRGAILLTDVSTTASELRSIQASAYDGLNAYLVDTFNSNISFWTASTSDSGHLFFARDDSNPGVTSIGFDALAGHIVTLGSVDVVQTPYDLNVINGYLLASSWGKLDAAAVSASGALTARATFDTPTNLWIQVSRAGVDPNAGIWLPEADYGVEFLGFSDL